MIVIVDYGLGNLESIKNMFKRVGEKEVVISSNKEDIALADKIILPGVGAFDTGMKNLKKYDLINILNKKALVEKVPFLGICLGMQLMTKGSEEGKEQGLGWFNAKVKFFNLEDKEKYKVPHMGWNYVERQKEPSLLKPNKKYRLYFVHSYYVECEEMDDVFLTTNYETPFHSGIKKDNLIGMQFHPEKSLHFGMDVFENFAKL